MERDYVDGIKNDVVFFTGMEVENTPQRGAHTLFVVGVHPVEHIVSVAERKVCRHIYLGANQSFDVTAYDDAAGWDRWDKLCTALLDHGYWVTLDFDIAQWLGACEMVAMSHAQFIPQISVKIPYAGLGNYNTCVKIDDTGFKASNPGVWVHSLHDLMDRKTFTPWSAYGQDEQA